MALVLTTAPTGELLSVEDAKRHLRVYDGSLDDEIASLIVAARDDCERETQRTLRTAVTRTLTRCDWWCSALTMPWPPLLGITSVAYYDADNASQTLSSTNYHVELSTEGFGRIVWTWNATIPAVYTRPDAVTVTFTTGYTAATIPPTALQLMKVRLSELWGDGTESEIKAAVECGRRLAGKIDATGYV